MVHAAPVPALAGGLSAPAGLRGKGTPGAGGRIQNAKRQITVITVLPSSLTHSPTLPLMVIITLIRGSAANGY